MNKFLAMLFLVLAALWPWAMTASAQEVKPQTVPLRVDNLESPRPMELYLLCGDTLRPLTTIEPGVVAQYSLQIVKVCPTGHLIVQRGLSQGKFELRKIAQRDREGTLGGLMLCLDDGKLYMSTSFALPLTCEAAREAVAE